MTALGKAGYQVEVLHGFPTDEIAISPLIAAWRTGDFTDFRRAHGPALLVARWK